MRATQFAFVATIMGMMLLSSPCALSKGARDVKQKEAVATSWAQS